MTDLDHLTEEIIAEYKDAFALYDRESPDAISTKDLGSVLRALGQNPNESELSEMQRKVDPESSGTIEFPEFLALMIQKMKEKDNEDELVEAFKNVW